MSSNASLSIGGPKGACSVNFIARCRILALNKCESRTDATKIKWNTSAGMV